MKRKFFSQALSLLLALTMCIGMLPMVVLAQDTAVDAGPWKIQAYGGDTDVELQEGWITPVENGFTLDYTKYVADTGKEGIVLYNSEAPVYADSSLSLDLTITSPAGGQDGFICMGPLTRVQDGKNFEGMGIASKYPSTTSIQRNSMKDGKESYAGITNELGLEFLYDKTYSLRLDTVGDTTTIYAKQDGVYEQLAVYSHDSGVDAGTYGLRVWRGGKVIKVENIVRTQIVPDESYLEENEMTIPNDAWGSTSYRLDIPVHFAAGDGVKEIKNGNALLVEGSDYQIDLDNSLIVLPGDFFKTLSPETDKAVLTVTFEKGGTDTYTITRSTEPAAENGWVIQKQGSTDSIEPEADWITTTPTGGVQIKYGEIIKKTGEGLVIFDGKAPEYLNSELEYDITFTDAAQAPWVAVVLATRVTDGKNYEGFAIEQGSSLQRQGRKDGSENTGGISNLAGLNFEYNKTYHIRTVTEGAHITAYVTAPGAAEKKLAEFDSPIGLESGSYGFRIWRGGKTITIENVERTEIVTSTLGRSSVQVDQRTWGDNDIIVPLTMGTGDSLVSVQNGEATLELDKDYALADGNFIVKKEYIKGQTEGFDLDLNFEKSQPAALRLIKYDPSSLQEYTWTPDMGIDEWESITGNGKLEMVSDGKAMHVTGTNGIINTKAPFLTNGEIEITFQALHDYEGHETGALFRAASDKWQAVASTGSTNGEGMWDFIKNNAKNRIVWDSTQHMSYGTFKDTKIKVRYFEDSITFWIDDQFAHTAKVSQAEVDAGSMGVYLDNQGDILVKKVVFREVKPFMEANGEPVAKTIEKDGLKVRLDSDFPRVIDYTLNSKVMKGAELRYNYVTINTVDYPATAAVTETAADSVTYHVTPDPERTGVTFDVRFTVKPDQILEMLILNIVEPEGEQVNSIGFTQQPMFSANSTQPGAMLDCSYVDENARVLKDIHEKIGDKKVSTVAYQSVTVPIITADGLSASMFNNALLDGEEFVYRAFDLGNGEVSVGAWNVEFMYRGVDDKKIMPFPSEPDESDLYCRVVITEDNNGDDIVNWQDGANALKKLTNGIIPGGEQAARSFFHVGYNFSSGAQQPFLQVADNMKRLSNCMDGFGQQLNLKGYANEGHDSGHCDYDDINKRAGGAEAMRVAIKEADKINANVGVHINAQETYPEAKMFSEITASDRNGWAWMDQSKILRRYAYMLSGGFEDRLNKLYEQVPDLDYVYVDAWGEDRWGEKKLIGTLLENGCEMFGNENDADFLRFGVWVHHATNNSPIHQFVYNNQKDIYGGSNIYFGGYGRSASMMSWQHRNDIGTMVKQFYTNQLPQKYLMCHEVERVADDKGYFSGNITSSGKVIMKDGFKLTDGENKIFIPWYDDSKPIKSAPNPDDADKIYHWNTNGGQTTWHLPVNDKWNDLATVYLYEATQNGKKLVAELPVSNHEITIDAKAGTGYVVYPAAAEADVTEWSVGSPLKDTNFNSRDFSVWQKGGTADIQFNDDGNGVSLLTMTGAGEGSVSQTMTGLVVGQKYRVKVDAGAENGKTARITVKNGDETVSAYLEEVTRGNNYFDDYAKGKKVQRVWVDFTATGTTAEVSFSGDACENENGKVTFMQSRIVKTAEPDLPNGYVANETFEYVEQGAYGIFNPERSADGVPHLSETHLPYTNDTISGDWSLKLYGHYGQGNVTVRTNPGVTRLAPNTAYMVAFDTLGNGKVYVQPDSTDAGRVLEQNFSKGHSEFEFTTGDASDYVVRVENASVLDNFQIWCLEDPTPPTAPANLTATAVENDNSVALTWDAATDDDGRVGGYRIYRDGELLVTIGNVTEYVDRDTEDETEYTYQVSAVNAGQTEGNKSNEVKVTTQILPPAPASAELNHLTEATVVFNKDMEKTSAETAGNYTITNANATVTAAALGADARTVTLTISGLGALDNATLNVKNVKDSAGNTISGAETLTLSSLLRYYKFDEAAGENAVDETGNEAGVKKRTVMSVDGKDGKAAQFNGDGYVDLTGAALYHQETYTISTWIKAGDNGKVRAIVSSDASGDASANALGITFQVRNDGKLHGNTHNGNYTWIDTVSEDNVPLDEWVHVAYVRRPGGYDLYLNGKKTSNESPLVSRGDFNGKLRIGGNPVDGIEGFVGAMDEFKIFKAALTEADVAKLMEDSAYSIEIAADKDTVQAGEDVTVTVTAKGGTYVGAACKMTFENDKFAVKSAPDGWETVGENSYSYFNVINSGFYPEDTVLGTFTFTARDQEKETTGSFGLNSTYMAGEWEDGWSTDHAQQVPNNGSVSVKITPVPTYAVEIVNDYVAGYSLVLVYTDNEGTAYSYDGAAMYDVTSAGYLCGGTKYTHVYGLVVSGKDATADKVASAAESAGTLTYTTDVNGSGTTDLNDAVAVVAVYNANEMYMSAIHMDIVLKADVNKDKKVDVDDFGLVKAEYYKA